MVDKYLGLVKVSDFYTLSFLLYGCKGSKTEAGLQKHFHLTINLYKALVISMSE